MPHIFVDADACPVKSEVYRVAARHGLRVTLVANAWLQTPRDEAIELVVVDGGLDVADDWIAEHAAEDDIVVTADIPLASRCLKKRARVLAPTGRIFYRSRFLQNLEETIRTAGRGRPGNRLST